MECSPGGWSVVQVGGRYRWVEGTGGWRVQVGGVHRWVECTGGWSAVGTECDILSGAKE